MWYNTGMYNSVPSNAIYVNGLKIELAGATFNSFDFLTAGIWFQNVCYFIIDDKIVFVTLICGGN